MALRCCSPRPRHLKIITNTHLHQSTDRLSTIYNMLKAVTWFYADKLRLISLHNFARAHIKL